MAYRAFFSFHYVPDNWRASQVRSMGVIEGNQTVSDNAWESVKKGGDSAIKKWIDEQMKGRSCAIVLIGSATAGRKWINYEIKKAWSDGKGIAGIHIHKLKNHDGLQSTMGLNPFANFTIDSQNMSNIVRAYNPPFASSTQVYKDINKNLEWLVEEAIATRKKFS